MPGWTLITNHGLVLSYISKHPRSTALELAGAVDLTERSIRKIIDDLESAGFIVRRREGRRNRYRIKPHITMSHPSHGEIAVGDLLEILGWKRRSQSIKARVPNAPQLPGFAELDSQTETETTNEVIGT